MYESFSIHISLLGSWGAIFFHWFFQLFSSLLFFSWLRITFSLSLLCMAVASSPFTGKNKTLSISSCVFKAWAGRIGVQIFIFLCFEGGIKEVFFSSSLYIIHVFCPAGLWKRWVERNGKKIVFQSENQNGNKQKNTKTLCLLSLLCFLFFFYTIDSVYYLLPCCIIVLCTYIFTRPPRPIDRPADSSSSLACIGFW